MTESTAFVNAARSGALVWSAQLSSYLLSFFLGIALAGYFGAGASTDAYFMATSTAELAAKLLLGGALVSVLLPVFVELQMKQEQERARILFSTLVSLAVLGFTILGGGLELAADVVVRFLTPGFRGDTQALTAVLLRITLPAYLFAFLADLLIVPLHARRRFGVPAFSRLVVPASTLLLLMLLARRLGVQALALGALLGTVLQVTILLVNLRRAGVSLRSSFAWNHPDVLRVLRLTLPFVLSVLAAQGAGIVYRILVSQEPEGSLASLKFSEKIFQMTNVLFLGSVTQVAFPIFAKAATTSIAELRDRLQTAVRIVMLLAVPLTVGLILLREPLVRVLYERGAFTAAATAGTAALVPLYAMGLLGNGLSSLLGHLVLAVQDTRMSVRVNIALQAIAASLFVLLTPSYHVAAFAFVSGLGPFLLTALYVFALRRRVPRLLGMFFDRHLAALLAAGALCALTLQLVTKSLSTLPAGFAHDLATLLAGAVAGTGAYGLAAWLLRVPEIDVVASLVKRVLQRLTPRPS